MTKTNKVSPKEEFVAVNEVGMYKKGTEQGGETEKPVSFSRLFCFSTKLDKFLIIIAAILSTIEGGMQQIVTIILGEITGIFIRYAQDASKEMMNATEKHILESNVRRDAIFFSVALCVFGIVLVTLSYFAGFLWTFTSSRQIFKMRTVLLKKMLCRDIRWYDKHETGDFASICTENISKVEEAIGEQMGTFIFKTSNLIVGVLMSLLMGWELTLVCLVSLPLNIVTMSVISRLSAIYSQKVLEYYGAAGTIAEEVLSSIKTVVAFDGQEKELERYEKHLITAKNTNLKGCFFNSLCNGTLWFLGYGCYSLSFWYGVELIIRNREFNEEEREYTPANMITIFFATLTATWTFGTASALVEIFGAATGAAGKIFELIDIEPNTNENKKSDVEVPKLLSSIVFENIHFSYPTRPDVKVLNGFNLTITSGETVALVGSSGCGKSTCIQLLQRFYDADSGNITINGSNIKNFNPTDFRKRLGVVNQEPVLFSTTIAENIRYGKLTATQDEIAEAARKADAEKFILTLPYAYGTVIGERGAQLSGGQKQKISIARALVGRPDILLLDEATSALDSTSEAEVQAAIDSLSGHCTTLIVAHRLSTIKKANKIVFISDGKVVESGTYSELMDSRGAYYRMVTSQEITETSNRTTTENQLNFSHDPVCKTNGGIAKDNNDNTIVNEAPVGSNKALFLRIMKMNRSQWWTIMVGCVASVLNGATLPLYGIVFGDVLGVLSIPDKDVMHSRSNIFCLYLLILGITCGIAVFFQIFCFGYAGEKLTLKIRRKTFAAMLVQEIGWFDKKENAVGSLCAQLSGDAASVQEAAGEHMGTLLQLTSSFLVAAIFSLLYQWKLAVAVLSILPLVILSIYYDQKVLKTDAEQKRIMLENSSKTAVEAIANIRTVVSLGCHDVLLEEYVKHIAPYVKSSLRRSHSRNVVLGFVMSLQYFAYAIGIGYGGILVIREEISYADMFKICECIIAGYWAIGYAMSFTPNFNKGLVAAEKIFNLLESESSSKNSTSRFRKIKDVEDIEYSEVYFSYPTRPSTSVLKGVNLTVQNGKTVAIVGASGSGKSTVIQLLEGFYKPTGGKLLVDDVNIKNIDYKVLRMQMGIVSQEPNLFDRTIAENIAYGSTHDNVSMSAIIESAKSANIHSFITSLPMGYETKIGSKGTQLSGGQKQRIAIARALIRNPRILLLDEATSALDNENEKIVQEALDKAKMNRTCITIAHRLTTIQNADVIYVLKDGSVMEYGTHTDLLEKRGLYYEFYKLENV